MAQLDEIRLEMEAEYEVMREAKRRGEIDGSIYLPENQTEHLAELREKMKVLQEQQKEFIVKDEFDQIYTEAGASGMNAGTMAGRHLLLHHRPRQQARAVVLDGVGTTAERGLSRVLHRTRCGPRGAPMRVESNPVAKYEEQFDFMFWGSVPYHHPVVGWPSDVESITRAQAEPLLCHLLRAQQHHRGDGRRFRLRGGAGSRQEVLRSHSPRRDHHLQWSPRRSSSSPSGG